MHSILLAGAFRGRYWRTGRGEVHGLLLDQATSLLPMLPGRPLQVRLAPVCFSPGHSLCVSVFPRRLLTRMASDSVNGFM